jgi:hypothetical protein
MESLAFLNKRSADPVMHLLLCWRENETPTPEQAQEAVCQAVYSLHQNTDNLHLHICVNRIDPETYKAIEAVTGKKVEISCRNDRIGEIREESQRLERSRGWSR